MPMALRAPARPKRLTKIERRRQLLDVAKQMLAQDGAEALTVFPL